VSRHSLYGHDQIWRTFEQAVGAGRLAHAYLFCGATGVGKRLFAIELAKALLCEVTRPGFEACQQCSSCRLMDAGNHPDFFMVHRPEDKVEMPIDTMRELCRSMGLKPALGRRRVAIVDDADDFNEESANCFLKTLEEPPPGSVLILISTSPERQLGTIVSRCQVVRFARLSESQVAAIAEEQGVERELAGRVSRLADGSPGQALALAEPALWAFRQSMLGALCRSPFDSVALGRSFMEFVEEAGKEGGPQRRRASLVLRLLVQFLMDLLHQLTGHAPRLVDDADARYLQELGKRLDADSTIEIIDRVLEADIQIDRRLQLKLVIEALLDAIDQKLASLATSVRRS
jgi:DNA polymerase III subunit delta'